jgi:hypothetical protein
MRTIDKIKADIAKVKTRLPEGYTNTDLCELTAEFILAAASGIPLDRLEAICDAERDGRCAVLNEKLALSMLAGARAIENNKRYQGARFVHDVHSECPQEISYYEAVKILREAAEAALKGAEHE